MNWLPSTSLNWLVLAGRFQEGEYAKIFDSTDFGFRKVTIERPLRLNFQVSEERIRQSD